MKILKSIFALIMIVSLASCNNDDDNDVYLLTNANLAGTHALTFLESEEVQTRIFNNLPSVSTISVVGDIFQVDLVLNENGSYTIEGQYRITETTVQDGNTNIDTEIILIDEGGLYTVNTSNLTLTMSFNGGESQTYDVTLFNEDELRLSYFEEGEITDGTYELTEELRMIKQ